MMKLTILTPTYNRRKELRNLYLSLCGQTCNNFEWIIVDDGSQDETEKEVRNWSTEHKISINYIKKENGGKHTALNVGVQQVKTEWTFIVDSDDSLTENAIEIFYDKLVQLPNNNNICGMAFLRKSKEGKYLTNKLVPYDGLIEDFCKCRYERGIKGDMAEIWKTSCLEEFPFPVFVKEHFLSEDVVWIKMAQKYQMIFYNQAIYISDYLDGGLTKTRREINVKSPLGCMYRGEVQLDANLPIKYKIRAMLYYSVYGQFAGFTVTKLLKKSKHKILYIVCLPISKVLYTNWRK